MKRRRSSGARAARKGKKGKKAKKGKKGKKGRKGEKKELHFLQPLHLSQQEAKLRLPKSVEGDPCG